MKLYVCGPMTGLPEFNYPAFRTAAERLTDAGYPSRRRVRRRGTRPRGWSDYMRRALGLLVQCQGVAVLAGWQTSRGARIEAKLAQDLGMVVAPVDEWLRRAETGAVDLIGVGAIDDRARP